MKYFLMFLFIAACVQAQTNPADIESFFQNHNGAFVMYDSANGSFFRYNEKRCMEYFLPASTFKIPNSVIGLETGVIEDENYVIKWDGIERGKKEWKGEYIAKRIGQRA